MFLYSCKTPWDALVIEEVGLMNNSFFVFAAIRELFVRHTVLPSVVKANDVSFFFSFLLIVLGFVFPFFYFLDSSSSCFLANLFSVDYFRLRLSLLIYFY